jgi:hypothetical protein
MERRFCVWLQDETKKWLIVGGRSGKGGGHVTKGYFENFNLKFKNVGVKILLNLYSAPGYPQCLGVAYPNM